MKIILFIFTLYCLFAQFKDVKTRFKPYKEKILLSINKLDIKDRNDTILSMVQVVMFILSLLYYLIAFNVIEVKIFQLILCLCFMWSMYDLSLYSKVYKGIDNKVMNSRTYSIISWILDTGFYGYIVYYIILNW